jgi:phosphoribosylanthranilate isomerase
LVFSVFRTRVKICGITSREDAIAAVEAGADAIGLVFYENSPRAVDIVGAGEILSRFPAMVTTVGLFVNAAREAVEETCAALPLSLLQFHGEEDPAFCASFGKPWMKVIRVAPGTDISSEASAYGDAAAILLDTFKQGVPGGTGSSFDWSRVPGLPAQELVLAGGLNAVNVGAAIRIVRPFAVDVSGGVELAPGRKSHTAMREFVAAVRTADHEADEISLAEQVR